MLRSILVFFMVAKRTNELHLGHFGLFFITNTYDKHTGHPTATGDDASAIRSQTPSSGDLRFFIISDESFPTLSRADFTLSSVQTLWKLELEDGKEREEEEGGDEEGTSFSSRLVSSKRLNNGLAGGLLETGGSFKS